MPSKMKLTAPQVALLKRIVKTSGGGIYSGNLNQSTMMALYNRGLIQGKKGRQHYAVHTKEGLQYIREIEKETP